MDTEKLRVWLEKLQAGELEVEELLERLRYLPYETVEEVAHLDHHRILRQGFPEFIFAQGKTAEQVNMIFRRIAKEEGAALATRVAPEVAQLVAEDMPEVTYDPIGRVLSVGGPLLNISTQKLTVGILTGGTSDMPVAEEAAHVLQFLGHAVQRFYDVGVSGLHRLLDKVSSLRTLDALIVVAGMEGALPSVVGGLVGVPVIAVPTSVGYGASFDGLSALLAMLNSCAAGILVTNIDNGFGAALAVHRMRTLRASLEHSDA